MLNGFERVAAGLAGGRHGRLQHSIADVAAARLVPLRERAEVYVGGEGRERRVHLDPPNLLALVHPRHLEQHVRAEATFKRRIKVRRKIGRKDDDPAERLEFPEEHVHDGIRLAQFESRELQVQPLQTTGLPQMIRVLNSARKNNRLYVRLVTRDDGAVVKGEPLAALPSSVLAVMEADRNGGSFRPLQSALVGEWEITPGVAVSGSRTLTLPLEE